MRLIEGREFTGQDREGAPPVAIVNDVLARRLSPDRPAAGMTIAAAGRSLTVVGVVNDAQYYVSGDAPRPQVFVSYWQSPAQDTFMNDSRTSIRVTGDPAAMMPQIRSAIAAVDPAVPVSEAHPLRERVAYMFQPVRMARMMLTASAVLALGLCAVGLLRRACLLRRPTHARDRRARGDWGVARSDREADCPRRDRGDCDWHQRGITVGMELDAAGDEHVVRHRGARRVGVRRRSGRDHYCGVPRQLPARTARDAGVTADCIASGLIDSIGWPLYPIADRIIIRPASGKTI